MSLLRAGLWRAVGDGGHVGIGLGPARYPPPPRRVASPVAPAVSRLPLFSLAVLLGGCLTAYPRVEAPTAPRAAPEAALSPEAFFLGETTGRGTLTLRGGRPQIVRVRSTGTPTDSGFVLRQTIHIGDDAPRERAWTLTRTGPASWTGTLTDARGPVRVTASGGRMEIRYKMGRATTMTQELTLQPDGRTLLNLSTVRVLGVPWARLVEWIRRAGPLPPAEGSPGLWRRSPPGRGATG